MGARAGWRIGAGAAVGLLLALAEVPLSAAAARQELPPATVMAGQELIYSGRFAEAQRFFADLGLSHPAAAAGPVLEASTLIWWGEARGQETFAAESIATLLEEGTRRAREAVAAAPDSAARAEALFWLGTGLGYQARQAELLGNFWAASRHARAMREALERALALDSACVDCLLGLGVYDYALARAGTLPRLVARIIGLGGGDARRGLEQMRRAAQSGRYTLNEARWVYGNALLRESDQPQREEGRRILAELAGRFPGNEAFRRMLEGRDGP